MNKIKTLLALSLMVVLFSCGKGIVEVNNDSFEYKIVVEGFLEPGKCLPPLSTRTLRIYPFLPRVRGPLQGRKDTGTVQYGQRPPGSRRALPRKDVVKRSSGRGLAQRSRIPGRS